MRNHFVQKQIKHYTISLSTTSYPKVDLREVQNYHRTIKLHIRPFGAGGGGWWWRRGVSLPKRSVDVPFCY